MKKKRGCRKRVYHKKPVNLALREEALRPSRFLGFSHDQMGLYLITRQAYELAESEFRRAIGLNPYEPSFKTHLAWCLYKRGIIPEAREWIDQAILEKPDSIEALNIYELIIVKQDQKLGSL